MASRALLRRLMTVSQRLPVRASVCAVRPLASTAVSTHGSAQTCLNCTQMRGLAFKAGDGMVIYIQDEKDFEDRVMNSKKPVVVDFHAGWCGPCKLLGPRLESIIGGKEGKVVLAKVDVDDQLELAMKFSISSVPTVLAVKNQKVMDKFVGLQDDDIIETFINRLIG